MNLEFNVMANSIIMWLACTPGILIVLYQSFIFYRKTVDIGLKMGITQMQMKAARKSAAITSIGPSFYMLTAMLSLMLYVGAPVAWLRVDYIGGTGYEIQGAVLTAEAMGIDLMAGEMNADFLVSAIIVMTLGCLGWVVFAAVFSDKMEVVNAKLAGGNMDMVPIIGVGTLIGVFSSMSLDNIYPYKTQTWAALGGALAMFLVQTYNKKYNKVWLKEWGLSICMIMGMIIATAVSYI